MMATESRSFSARNSGVKELVLRLPKGQIFAENSPVSCGGSGRNVIQVLLPAPGKEVDKEEVNGANARHGLRASYA